MRQTLRKSEIISKRSNVSAVFETGKRISGGSVHLAYLVRPRENVTDNQVRVAFGLSRMIRGAVRRNTLKRRMREAYRRGKSPLIEAVSSTSASVEMVWIGNAGRELENRLPSQEQIDREISKLVDTVRQVILSLHVAQ